MRNDDLSLLERMFDTIVKPLSEPLVAGPDPKALGRGKYVPSKISSIKLDSSQYSILYERYIGSRRKKADEPC